MGTLRRMHSVGTGSLIDGFEPFERFERHPSFELAFRTLFRTSEAILEEPLVRGGSGAIYRLFHTL